jgi:hypothetical protein
MKGIGDGGPAFPEKGRHGGMTLRDYFAGQALMGILTRGAVHGTDAKVALGKAAYGYADAMLAGRGTA